MITSALEKEPVRVRLGTATVGRNGRQGNQVDQFDQDNQQGGVVYHKVAPFVRWYSTVRNPRAGGPSGAESIYDQASDNSARLALDPQVDLQPRFRSDQAHQRLRAMDVEVIRHDVPAGGGGIGGDGALDVGPEVRLGAGGTVGRRDDLAGHDIPIEDEAPGAMAEILELASLHHAGSQRQVGGDALQSLHPRHLIGAHHPLPLLGQLGRLPVQVADVLHLLVEILLVGRRQPIADEMGFEVPLFKSRAAWRGEMCSMMPRVIISSAISRLLH
jgi:hypothetical protein